jgi:hypothetical protein
MRVARWFLFLAFLITTWLHLGLREHRFSRLDSATGHFYVTKDGSRREVNAVEFQELSKLQTLSWTLFWGSAALCAAWGISLAWHYDVKPYLQSHGR